MADMISPRTPADEQPASERIHNFSEVALTYTAEDAKKEAGRCLNCKNPKCVEGCPVGIDIPGFIEKISAGDFTGAYDRISLSNSLPAVCGRVCPQESQCEGRCIRGMKSQPVAIGRLERFCADNAAELKHSAPAPECTQNGIKIAVVGSGPSGLACAAQAAKLGYSVTVFEAFHKAGGVLAYGIPEFRLPKAIVASEIDALKSLGVELVCNAVVGKAFGIEELFDDGYKAVFLGTGAGLPKFMDIPGENLIGVFSANEYLTRINLMKAYIDEYDTPIMHAEKVAVVGGGNVAMDAARCAKRMGADVYLVYRRTEKEMPARAEELHHAKEEGVKVLELTAPVSVLDDGQGHVKGLRCLKMALGEPDASGRARPVEIPGSEFDLELDAVISAIGTSPNPILAKSTKALAFDRRGCVIADPVTHMTSIPGVFAGGDLVSGAATVILAMGAGRDAAYRIDEYIHSKK